MNRACVVTTLTAALLGALAIGAWYMRRHEQNQPKVSARPEPKVDEIPALPDPTRKDSTQKTTMDPKLSRKMPTVAPDDGLGPDRGRQATNMYRMWLKTREREVKSHVEQLAANLGVPSERLDALRTLLADEEKKWREDLERRLQPTFEGKAPPSYTYTETPEYKAFIDEITGLTDRAVVLDRDQVKPYQDWRSRYIKRMYFYIEERR